MEGLLGGRVGDDIGDARLACEAGDDGEVSARREQMGQRIVREVYTRSS